MVWGKWSRKLAEYSVNVEVGDIKLNKLFQYNSSLSKKKSSNEYFWIEQRDTKMLDRWICIEDDNPPIGIVLAREKDELQIKYFWLTHSSEYTPQIVTGSKVLEFYSVLSKNTQKSSIWKSRLHFFLYLCWY